MESSQCSFPYYHCIINMNNCESQSNKKLNVFAEYEKSHFIY